MKKWLLHIMLVGMLGMLAASCSQDEEIANIPSTGTPSEKVTIRFTLDLGEQGGMSSRATWEGYDEDDAGDSNQAEPGIIDNENYIITNSLQVFMFNLEGEYIGGLKDMEAERQGNSNIYNIKGEVDVVKTAIVNDTLNCKIMVVANADAASVESGKVTDFNNAATFNHNVSYIPMWGIGTYEIDLIQQLIVDLDEPIYMLRSMAKIEVTLNQTVYAEGYRITSATLNKYNTQGYVVPTLPVTTGDNPVVDWSKLTNTTSLSTANVFREYDRLAGTLSNPISKSFSENEKGSYVIYVPEYDNDGSLDITLGLSNGTTDITNSLETNKIKLNVYSNGKPTNTPIDLVRNHWYQYTINKVNDGANIDVTCQVQPWELQQQVIDYTSEPAAAEGGKIGWIGAIPDASNQVTLNSNLEAQCTFTLNSPLGYQWVASLVPVGDGASAANSPFRFVTNGQVAGMDTSGIIDGKPVTLTIKSTATDGVDEDKAVQLQIIVIKGDGTSVVLDKDVIGGPYTVIHTK